MKYQFRNSYCFLTSHYYLNLSKQFSNFPTLIHFFTSFFFPLQAIKNSKMFILDHHDTLMPYLRRINTTATKTYATRTLLLLEEDGTLKPLAIELSLPHPQGDKYGATSQVFTPAEKGIEGSIWQLAKAYASVNDSGYHQLISHWYDLTDLMKKKYSKADHINASCR